MIVITIPLRELQTAEMLLVLALVGLVAVALFDRFPRWRA